MDFNTELVEKACAMCGWQSDRICRECKTVFYCSEAHRQRHFDDHGEQCLEIQAARATLEDEEEALDENKDIDLESILACIKKGKAPGLQHRCFCAISCSKYMMARFVLLSAYNQVNSHRAIVRACNLAIETQYLGRCDPMSIRCITANLMIRVGSKQNAYDFIRFWLTNGDQYDCHAKPPQPFMNVRDADAFEPCQSLLGVFKEASVNPPVSFLIPLILIKLKLLPDIKNLRNLQLLRAKLPFDIVHMIKGYFQSTDIMEDRHDIGRIDSLAHYEGLVGQLEKDMDDLFEICGKSYGGEYIVWKAFFEEDPVRQVRRYPKHVRMIHNYSCDAWRETPGGYEWILEKLANACKRELQLKKERKLAGAVRIIVGTDHHTVIHIPPEPVTQTTDEDNKKKKYRKRGKRGKKWKNISVESDEDDDEDFNSSSESSECTPLDDPEFRDWLYF